jgi:superoxide dismutase, Fe-Mn family
MNKRQFLKNIGLLSIATSVLGFNKATTEEDTIPFTETNQYLQKEDKFTLPALPYSYDALEAYIDKQTMEIHHGKHHKAYVDNLNKAVAANPNAWKSLEEIIQKLNKKSEPLLRNNAGGHWNHSFFWETMSATKNQTVGAKTAAAINKAFGDYDKFKDEFTKAAVGRFGSGWAWLCKDKNGDLFITSTPNQDNPLMKKLVDKVGTPVMGIDVWEHAYYLKYQNKRADYIKSFFVVLNWDKVEERMG